MTKLNKKYAFRGEDNAVHGHTDQLEKLSNVDLQFALEADANGSNGANTDKDDMKTIREEYEARRHPDFIARQKERPPERPKLAGPAVPAKVNPPAAGTHVSSKVVTQPPKPTEKQKTDASAKVSATAGSVKPAADKDKDKK